jgi:hypothetical protein
VIARGGRARALPRWAACLVAAQCLWLAGCSQPPGPTQTGRAEANPVPTDPLQTIIPAAQIARSVGWQLAGTPRGERMPLAHVVSLAVAAGPNSDAAWRLTEARPVSGSAPGKGRQPQ